MNSDEVSNGTSLNGRGGGLCLGLPFCFSLASTLRLSLLTLFRLKALTSPLIRRLASLRENFSEEVGDNTLALSTSLLLLLSDGEGKGMRLSVALALEAALARVLIINFSPDIIFDFVFGLV